MKKRLLVSWEGSEGGADLVKTAKRLIKSQVIKWQRPVQGEGVTNFNLIFRKYNSIRSSSTLSIEFLAMKN